MRERLHFLSANPVVGRSAVAPGTYFRLISAPARDHNKSPRDGSCRCRCRRRWKLFSVSTHQRRAPDVRQWRHSDVTRIAHSAAAVRITSHGSDCYIYTLQAFRLALQRGGGTGDPRGPCGFRGWKSRVPRGIRWYTDGSPWARGTGGANTCSLNFTPHTDDTVVSSRRTLLNAEHNGTMRCAHCSVSSQLPRAPFFAVCQWALGNVQRTAGVWVRCDGVGAGTGVKSTGTGRSRGSQWRGRGPESRGGAVSGGDFALVQCYNLTQLSYDRRDTKTSIVSVSEHGG